MCVKMVTLRQRCLKVRKGASKFRKGVDVHCCDEQGPHANPSKDRPNAKTMNFGAAPVVGGRPYIINNACAMLQSSILARECGKML